MGSDFRILGELEVLHNGDPVSLGSPRQRAVLARLLINAGETVSTDTLIDDLWGDEAAETAKHTLHVYVSRLRNALGPDRDRLIRQGAGYRMNVEQDELDSSRFSHLSRQGREALARDDVLMAHDVLEEALSLWRGPALADFTDEEFARDEAIRLNELRLATLEQRLWCSLKLAKHREVVSELQELVAQHPFRETFWEQLMLALYRCGRQAEALRAYQTARTVLAGELGIEPGNALRILEDQILNHDPGLNIGSAPRVGAASTLPLQRTSFVGRSTELSTTATLLARSRLLTLTGPPGSGKTRLALRLADDLAHQFEHGVFFVPLAPIADPALFADTVGRILGVHETPGESTLDRVCAFSGQRSMLLVLDNFEHVLDAAPKIGTILDSAPRLKVLVTSRTALHIVGEQRFQVPPLSTPPVSQTEDAKDLASYDAVALFVARAQAVDPGFRLDRHNASSVAGITARVDGLPLAIELAAARVGLLGPDGIFKRLDQRLPLLTGGPSDGGNRHQTMRNAISWSYDLLEPADQLLFRYLAPFSGGFTLDGVAAVADLSEDEALDRIDSLLAQSLISRPADVGEARFLLLELTREFATEQLIEAGEASIAADRHLQYFADLAEAAETHLSRDPGGRHYQLLMAEHDNIRAALAHALASDQPDLGLALASAIWRYWQSSDQITEGRRWLDRLLEHPLASDAARAHGHTAYAGLAYWQADYESALSCYKEALEIYQAQGDRLNEADTYYSMSLTVGWERDLDGMERYALEADRIFRELDSPAGLGKLALLRASLLWWKDDYAGARDMWIEALDIAEQVGDRHLILTGRVGLASLSFLLGNRNEALDIISIGLIEAMDAQNDHITVWMLDLVAGFAAHACPEAAVSLAGAVDEMRNKAGGGIPAETLMIDDARNTAARMLGKDDLDRCWRDGHALDRDAACAQALQLIEQTKAASAR